MHRKPSYMRMTSLYAPTLREDPQDAELASHKLLLRAGFIRKTAAGLYSYLPLAWRSLRKIEEVVREEMDAIGSQEILVPILTPAELWADSGRWDDYGPELMRMNDRHERTFALGPTHEETFTDLVRNELKSYKQLPVTLYQIQDKFRDEARPRFGLMRGREFIMKDAYSFHADRESLQETYDQMSQAYANICDRLRVRYAAVEADSGQIGGKVSVEFMALADAGEADLVSCPCGYAADVEAAECHPHLEICQATECALVETPGASTIESLAAFLGVPASMTVKAFAVVAEDGSYHVVFVPGDHEVNEVALEHRYGLNYRIMTDDDIKDAGLVKGFIGPKGISPKVSVIADESLKVQKRWICGANQPGYHYVGAECGVDFPEPEYGFMAAAKAGDACPVCGKPLSSERGIEVSQVFQLGTKYSEAMGATFADENGNDRPFLMGCYGVGISRMLAAVVEQYNDEAGITWPVAVAPYEVAVVPLSVGDDLLDPMANAIAAELSELGVEVVLDDRKERPGVKFADMDLMGFPYQVVIGKKSAAEGNVELKVRATGERSVVPAAEVAKMLAELVESQRA